MVRGLDTSAVFFAGDEQRYTLIGVELVDPRRRNFGVEA